MILTPVYCSSEPPPASGPVRSKMTPILIFFSWASALTAIPSMAIAADSPTRRRAALRPGMESSLGLFFVHCVLLFLLPPITLVARPDVKRVARDDSAQADSRGNPARQGWEANCASRNTVTKRGIAGLRS